MPAARIHRPCNAARPPATAAAVGVTATANPTMRKPIPITAARRVKTEGSTGRPVASHGGQGE